MEETESAAAVEPTVDEADPVTVADKPREPTEYEKRLRRENAAERVKRKETERELTAARQAIEAAKADVQTAVERARAEATTTANERIVRAELKAAAIAAGMVDLDGLKLLNLSAVKLDDAGEVSIPEDFFAKAKEAKPYLFGSVKTTSTAAEPPKAEPPTSKTAADMTPAELRALGNSMGIRV
ncbi:MAG: hypothetical protein NVS3B5_18920 [Sphingomicrobium sp.]